MRKLRTFYSPFMLGLLLLCPRAVWAEDVLVVLSSNLKPYQETLAGIQQVLGEAIRVLYLSDRKVSIPSGTQVIVAIGGEAALQNYPRDVALVYCLAPGVQLSPIERKAPTEKVQMTPSASIVMKTLKGLQPALGKLGILGLSDRRDEFSTQMQQAGEGSEVQVILEKLKSPRDLPEHLRSLQSRINALWIPPDPRLITRQNFDLIKEFCLSNHIAFYAPTTELVEQGATASVAVSFQEMGRTAGEIAKDLTVGSSTSRKGYPKKAFVAINLKSAAEIGLKLTPDQIQQADKVVP